jgi:hypothetical protein
MSNENEDLIAKVINEAEEVRDPGAPVGPGEKPRVLVDNCNPDQTVAALRDLLSTANCLYDRGAPVRSRVRSNAAGHDRPRDDASCPRGKRRMQTVDHMS